MTTIIRSDFRLGYLGAGQLARMSALQAFNLGIRVASFSDRNELEPLEFLTPDHTKGSFTNAEEMAAFAGKCDLITLENEFISSDLLRKVELNSGKQIFPSPETFEKIENKLIEKQTFENAGIPVTPYRIVSSEKELEAFGDEHGWPYLLKSSKGGYDGYGNETAKDLESAIQAFEKLGGQKGHDILAEAFVDFTHELAVQVARNETGAVTYPCCETVQENHICVAVKSPAPVDSAIQKKAGEMALAATEAIDGKGLFAYEFFLTRSGDLLLNESAPRPHNSGHYTIEGAVTSQFENHVRAVTGLPLGSTELVRPAVVMINLLGTDARPARVENATDAINEPDGHLHIYGKTMSKPGRKMGHYTLLGQDTETLFQRARELTRDIRI